MKITPLKKKRLEAGMTQMQVAEGVGVSQPNYQRWESENAPVPQAKLKKLANVLKTSADEILGKPRPFDIPGVDKTVENDRKYYGEVAIHFGTRNPLLLPISEAERHQLHKRLSDGTPFFYGAVSRQ